MTENFEELDVVKEICLKLRPFSEEKRRKILRWVGEVVGAEIPEGKIPEPQISPVATFHSETTTTPRGKKDIKSFIGEKKPSSDVQFAVAVAYYFQFEASPKKESVSVEDLTEAVRLVNWKRFKRPDTPFQNAVTQGLLDRGKDKGTFRINSVGENLVAMAMPGNTKAK